MKTRLLLIFIFTVLSVLSLYGVYYGQYNSETSGVLANLGTGFVGTISTVLIVDWLYERRENARVLPKRVVAHEDVRLLVVRTVGFWFDAYMASVPGDLPATITELVNRDSFNKIYGHLDLNSEPNVTPSRTWWQFLPEQLGEFQRRCDMILHRHSEILEPEAYLLVNKFVRSLPDPNFSTTIRRSDAEFGYPRPHVLGGHIVVLSSYFSALLELVSWCNREAEEIKKAGIREVLTINESLIGNRPAGTPRCMIDPVQYAVQRERLAAYERAKETHVGQ
ncbi:hypothetical protein GTP58_00320 [Duganella sp. CY15W]|uniref:hypothetical protein n=1 Tax=Duganella sp. CY15W TaxID=2692172 RepID=UPI00136876BA|nr:hypothetical protein [Duganella sp. CY15W]MYM26761.1 hypothetical protein [Duganella sp. CY15W]